MEISLFLRDESSKKSKLCNKKQMIKNETNNENEIYTREKIYSSRTNVAHILVRFLNQPAHIQLYRFFAEFAHT